VYERKPISLCQNYILSLNSHFRTLKEPIPQSVIQNWKMQPCLPALYWQQQSVTALESEYLNNSTSIQPFAQPLLSLCCLHQQLSYSLYKYYNFSLI